MKTTSTITTSLAHQQNSKRNHAHHRRILHYQTTSYNHNLIGTILSKKKPTTLHFPTNSTLSQKGNILYGYQFETKLNSNRISKKRRSSTNVDNAATFRGHAPLNGYDFNEEIKRKRSSIIRSEKTSYDHQTHQGLNWEKRTTVPIFESEKTSYGHQVHQGLIWETEATVSVFEPSNIKDPSIADINITSRDFNDAIACDYNIALYGSAYSWKSSDFNVSTSDETDNQPTKASNANSVKQKGDTIVPNIVHHRVQMQ